MNEIQIKELEVKYKVLGKIVGLFIVINISLFVTTGLVSNFKYYFPLIALAIFSVILFYMTFPSSKLLNKKSYVVLFAFVWLGIYFTGASILYMVEHGHFNKMFE